MDSTIELERAHAAGSGDSAAQDAIVRIHYEEIHRLARHLSRNHAEAPDLAQQTFIKACSNASRFDGRTTLRAWLVGILLHEYSHWRRGRRFFVELREHLSPDPSNQIVDREILLNAIHRLPKSQCETFLLVEVHGLSIAEAATALGVPGGTVKSRLSEARIRLRRLLNDRTDPIPSPKEAPIES